MSPKSDSPDARLSTTNVESFAKHTGSHNEWTFSSPKQAHVRLIQTRGKDRALAALTAEERAALAARFWSKVDRRSPHTCWLWTASGHGRYGHGQFAITIQGTYYHFGAHRISWFLAHGDTPTACVCHRCDVARCVNPAHLFLGTQQDNLQDARQKGRLDETRPRTKVLTPDDRLTIYLDTTSRGVDLARAYGVSEASISLIRSGRFARGSRRQQPLQSVASQPHQPNGPLEGSSGAVDVSQ